MSILGGTGIRYADALAAIGRFLARKQLTDVCIMEFEQGVIITGSVLYETGEHYNRRIETHILSPDDLNRLIKEA